MLWLDIDLAGIVSREVSANEKDVVRRTGVQGGV